MFKKILLAVVSLSILALAGISYAQENNGDNTERSGNARPEIFREGKSAVRDIRQYRDDYRSKRDDIRKQREDIKQTYQGYKKEAVDERKKLYEERKKEMEVYKERYDNAKTEEEKQQIIDEAKKRREEIKKEIENKKSEIRNKITERYTTVYQQRIALTKQKFEYVIARMGRVEERLQKAIDILQSKGVDMSEAKKHAALAKDNLEKSKKLFEDTIKPVTIENVKTRDDLKKFAQDAKNRLKNVIDSLKSTRTHLIASIKIIRTEIQKTRPQKPIRRGADNVGNGN